MSGSRLKGDSKAFMLRPEHYKGFFKGKFYGEGSGVSVGFTKYSPHLVNVKMLKDVI